MDKNYKYKNAANLKADTAFPFFVRSAQNRIFSAGDVGFGVMHWHEDLQFMYVTEGKACIKLLDGEHILSGGEGAFVNSGVIHCSMARLEPCSYKLFRFPEWFLNFYPGSPAERFTKKITENSGLRVIVFRRTDVWCIEVLNLLKELTSMEAWKDKNEFYEYDVMTILTQLWQLILHNIETGTLPPTDQASVRVRKFLEFIEDNYAKEITLQQLAESAGVSKTEALRCFKSKLGTTPYRYVMKLRLSKAAELLSGTGLTVSEIAEINGFHQQSYFGKCFKEETGLTPLEYRKQCRSLTSL